MHFFRWYSLLSWSLPWILLISQAFLALPTALTNNLINHYISSFLILHRTLYISTPQTLLVSPDATSKHILIRSLTHGRMLIVGPEFVAVLLTSISPVLRTTYGTPKGHDQYLMNVCVSPGGCDICWDHRSNQSCGWWSPPWVFLPHWYRLLPIPSFQPASSVLSSLAVLLWSEHPWVIQTL